jgi:flavin-dependent dehydrogenase
MAHPLSIAIVGSGPSGVYCARLLSEDGSLDARVDVYERLGRDRVKLHDRTRLLDAASAVSASQG